MNKAGVLPVAPDTDIAVLGVLEKACTTTVPEVAPEAYVTPDSEALTVMLAVPIVNELLIEGEEPVTLFDTV